MAFKFNFFPEQTGTKDETYEHTPEVSDKPILQLDIAFLEQEPSLVPLYSSPSIRDISGIEFVLSLNPRLEELTAIHSKYSGVGAQNQTQLSDWLKGTSDLVPGVYEGGFRLWEGAIDLVEFLTNQNVVFEDKLVLELGTGIGLPGILALKRGAKVWFQDYNIEVLECATIPHTFMNISNHGDVFKNATYLSGSWSSLVPYSKQNLQKFDIIMTAETIYEASNYPALLELFDKLIVPNGTIIIAAKQTYFGLSGSTKEFKDFVSKIGTFQCKTVVTIETSVPREILILSRLL